MYRRRLIPILTHAAETMTMMKKGEKMFLIQERKIITRMLGGIMLKNEIYRRRTNNEIMKEVDGENVPGHIKMLRTKWVHGTHV